MEPPVPSGLQKLTPPLRAFMEAFHIDESLVTVAAATSPQSETLSKTQLQEKIAVLPRDVCNDWLPRLVQGEEAHLALLFQRYLLAEQKTGSVTQGTSTAFRKFVSGLR